MLHGGRDIVMWITCYCNIGNSRFFSRILYNDK